MSDEKQQVLERIRTLVPINELPAQVQNDIISSANLQQIKKGGEVFKQGDRDGFSYYVIDGDIELHANNQLHNTIVGGTDRATYAMAQLQPRQFTAKAKTAAVIFQISRDQLDKLMVLHEKEAADDDTTVYDLATAEVEVSEIDSDDEVDWMSAMLQSELFAGMPTANIHQLFALLESVDYKTGDIVIKQGDPGEHYYIIQEGRCEVLRQPPSGGKDLRLATLKAGDSFGEEALITETTRNATVRMISDGMVAQLSKDNFINLIKKPTLKAISSEQAEEIVNAGGKWLDVRFKKEHEQSSIEGSINMPLNMLRMSADKLDNSVKFVLYCDTGGRSSTGAFVLTERGFDVYYLDGGLVNHPELAPPEDVTQTKAVEKAPAPAPEPAVEEDDDEDITTLDSIQKEDIDPEIKASVLEAELAKTNRQIEEAAKIKDDDKTKEQARLEAEKKLKEERAKIEQAKKEAEQAAAKLKAQEEAKLKALKEKAAQRLQEEKKKLDEVYSRNAEEVAKLEAMKKEAADKLQQEKAMLEKQAEEAKKNMADAEKIKAELAAARKAMEEEAARRQQEQEEMQQRIQEIAREKLAEERKKMAEEYARNNAELEAARREIAEAEAARLAAKKEAELVIAEFKSKHEIEREQEQEKIRAEREKLEVEQRKIQEALLEVQKAREEADAAKKQAMEEVAKLKAKQSDDDVTTNKEAQENLKQEIKKAEAKVSLANVEIAKSQQAKVKVEAERKVNEEDLAHKRKLEEEFRKKLEADFEDFHKEQEEYQKKFADDRTTIQHMNRIKDKANAAKQAAKDADSGLLDDIADQLGKSD